MNQKVYNKVCRKVGHDWVFKDCDTFMLKVCLNCGCEQYFFPEEVEEEPKIWGQTWSDDE